MIAGLEGLLSHYTYIVTIFLMVSGLFVVIARGTWSRNLWVLAVFKHLSIFST